MANLSSIREKLHNAESSVEEQKVVTEFSSLAELEGIGFKDEYQARIQESVDNVIKNSKNLICALEGIGAMYCIPAGHIMRNDDINTIKISGDNIIAPGNVNAINNKHAVVRAIAALLDKKSAGIDDKLNAHHKHHCHELMKMEPQFTPDPGKGTVVGRYLDDEDNEILVYNTGMVDCKTCPSSMKKIDELRKQGLIPDYNIALVQGCGDNSPIANYFADMDDITQGVDMQTSTTANTTTGEDTVTGMEMTDISGEIGEDETLVEAYSVFGDTRTLGYDLMTLQGFDFVKPTIVTESDTSAADDNKEPEEPQKPSEPNEPKKPDEPQKPAEPEEYSTDRSTGNDRTVRGRNKNRRVDPTTLKFMRFDNKHIINAVRYINDWVEDNCGGSNNLGTVKFDKLYKSREFKDAIDELCEQFDASIVVHYRNYEGAFNVYTSMTEERFYKLKNVEISKSKGFQFNNNKIDIHIEGANTIRDFSADKVELVGQTIISVLLHEIFHNAMWVWKSQEVEFNTTMTLSLQLAMAQKDAKKRRKIIENFVNYIDNFYGCKLNAIKRKVIVKRLTVVTGLGNQKGGLEAFKNKFKKAVAKEQQADGNTKIDNDIKELVNMYENYMQREEKRLSKKNILIKTIIGAVMFAFGLSINLKEDVNQDSIMGRFGALSLVAGGLVGLSGLGAAFEAWIMGILRNAYENEKDLEEMWCDMFAAMYKLPVTFKVMTRNKSYTPDKISKEVMEDFNRVNIQLHKFIMDCHPSDSERNYQAVGIANNLLKEKKMLDPAVVKYLEWLVEAYKKTGDQHEIRDIYNKSVFNPSEADDLDKHLEHLAKMTGAPVVEFTAYDVLDWGSYIEA